MAELDSKSKEALKRASALLSQQEAENKTAQEVVEAEKQKATDVLKKAKSDDLLKNAKLFKEINSLEKENIRIRRTLAEEGIEQSASYKDLKQTLKDNQDRLSKLKDVVPEPLKVKPKGFNPPPPLKIEEPTSLKVEEPANLQKRVMRSFEPNATPFGERTVFEDTKAITLDPKDPLFEKKLAAVKGSYPKGEVLDITPEKVKFKLAEKPKGSIAEAAGREISAAPKNLEALKLSNPNLKLGKNEPIPAEPLNAQVIKNTPENQTKLNNYTKGVEVTRNELKLEGADFDKAKVGTSWDDVLETPSGQKISVARVVSDVEEAVESAGGNAKSLWAQFKEKPTAGALTLVKKALKEHPGKIGVGVVLAGGAYEYLQRYFDQEKEKKPEEPPPTPPSDGGKKSLGNEPGVKTTNEFSPFQADLSKTKEQQDLEKAQEGLRKKVTEDSNGKIKYLENGETKDMAREDYIRQAYQDQKVAIANAIDLYKQESSENRKTQIFKSLVEGIAQLINGAYGFRNADRGVVVQDLKFDPMPWLDRSEEIKQNLNSNLAQAKNGVEIAERNKQLSDEELTQKIQSQKVLVDIAGRNADYANRVRDKQNELNQFNYLQEKRQRELESSNGLKDIKDLAKSDKNAGKLLQDITAAATEWDVLVSQGDSEKAAEARAKLAGLLGDPNNEKFLKVREDIAKRNSSGIFTYVFGISEADQRKFTKPALLQMLNAEQESQPSSTESPTKDNFLNNRWHK